MNVNCEKLSEEDIASGIRFRQLDYKDRIEAARRDLDAAKSLLESLIKQHREWLREISNSTRGEYFCETPLKVE